MIVGAKRPLVIIGKGAAYSRAEKIVTEFVEKHALPFLPTPMGKGVIRDDHPLCVSAARSKYVPNVRLDFSGKFKCFTELIYF